MPVPMHSLNHHASAQPLITVPAAATQLVDNLSYVSMQQVRFGKKLISDLSTKAECSCSQTGGHRKATSEPHYALAKMMGFNRGAIMQDIDFRYVGAQFGDIYTRDRT
jgi:hypothetical protein